MCLAVLSGMRWHQWCSSCAGVRCACGALPVSGGLLVQRNHHGSTRHTLPSVCWAAAGGNSTVLWHFQIILLGNVRERPSSGGQNRKGKRDKFLGVSATCFSCAPPVLACMAEGSGSVPVPL